jgi:deoxycytidylate deaminase
VEILFYARFVLAPYSLTRSSEPSLGTFAMSALAALVVPTADATIPAAVGTEDTPTLSIAPAAPAPTTKRDTAIDWDDYFMAISFLSSMRSKDPSTQVGACIVNSDRRIVGIGYNGFPRGCSDDILPWARTVRNDRAA